jgi:hypothetical protein
MAFSDELLELAYGLANLHPEGPHQASLRRAVSTAYYAIFHLLISDATANWARPELRTVLARCFDHGPMRTASERVPRIRTAPKGTDPTVAERLSIVAKAFVQAQQRRNDADYDLAKEWAVFEVEQQIDSVKEAFQAWHIIREEAVAQAYLLSLLGTRDRRSTEPKPTKPMADRKKKRRGSENLPEA